MDTIVTTALIGTGQHGSPDITTGTAIDPLAAQLVGEDVERRLLLMAGALAFYRKAGQIALSAPALPEAAATETLQPCSVKVAQILSDLLQGEHSDLLPEAYALLEKAHQRLPFELLLLALEQGTRDTRGHAHLLSILGERGRWLCQFNTAWSWVKRLETRQVSPADLENLWQEGTVKQRTEILLRVRATEPAEALEWLEAVWKQEKADARAAFLETLETGLSMADQPFLAHALDDRGESVRTVAARLLALLTASPQALRLRDRADELVRYEGGKIIITLPASIDRAWMHDVAILKPAENKSTSKAYWLIQALSHVPPTHWEERFSITPSQFLIDIKDAEWSLEVVGALTDAAIMHARANWFIPLIDWYTSKIEAGAINSQEVLQHYYALLSHLPQQEAESRVLQQLTRQDYLLQSVQYLPTPWSDKFSADCLQSLKDYYHLLNKDQPVTDHWFSVIRTATVSLAPSCLDAALAGWNLTEDGNSSIQYCNEQLHTFLQKISIRKRLIEETR